jgi:hypothetical protein
LPWYNLFQYSLLTAGAVQLDRVVLLLHNGEALLGSDLSDDHFTEQLLQQWAAAQEWAAAVAELLPGQQNQTHPLQLGSPKEVRQVGAMTVDGNGARSNVLTG